MSVSGFLGSLAKSLYTTSDGDDCVRIVGVIGEGSTPSGFTEDQLKGSLTTDRNGDTALRVVSGGE